MGLEIAELMLEVEERYAIEIDEDDVKDLSTFGDLVDLVKRKIDEPLRPEIAESSYEIILSSFLAELLSLIPKEIQVDETTKLSELKPFVKRRDIWSIVQKRFPELPSWKQIGLRRVYFLDKPTIFGFFGVMVVWMIVFTCIGERPDWRISIAAMVACLGTGLGWLFLFAGRLPHRTIGDVVKEIVEKRQKRLRASQLSSDEVEYELRNFVCKAFALKSEKVRRESELVKDLGLG